MASHMKFISFPASLIFLCLPRLMFYLFLSSHPPISLVAYADVLRQSFHSGDRMLTNNMKSPSDVKDNLGHDIKTNDAAIGKCQLLILEPYPHGPIHG